MFLSYMLSKFFSTVFLVPLTLGIHWVFRRFLLTGTFFATGIIVIFVPDQIAMNQWEELCRTDSGLKIYETHTVDGFYFEGGGLEDATAYLNKGYKYVEFDSRKPLAPGTVGRVTAQNSEISYEEKAISSYKYSLIYYRVNDELAISEKRITETNGERVMASTKKLYFFGGPIFRAIQAGRRINSSDFVSACPRDQHIDSVVDRAIPPK